MLSYSLPRLQREEYALKAFSRFALSGSDAMNEGYAETVIPISSLKALFSARRLFPNFWLRAASRPLISEKRAFPASSRATPFRTKRS